MDNRSTIPSSPAGCTARPVAQSASRPGLDARDQYAIMAASGRCPGNAGIQAKRALGRETVNRTFSEGDGRNVVKRLVLVAIAAMALSTTGYASANGEDGETGDSSAVEASCDDVTIDKPCTDLQADLCHYTCESARRLRECSVLRVENHTSILEAAIDHREEVVKVIADRYAFPNDSAESRAPPDRLAVRVTNANNSFAAGLAFDSRTVRSAVPTSRWGRAR